LEEALKKYDMGDEATIKEIIAEVDTDHVSNSIETPKIIPLAVVSIPIVRCIVAVSKSWIIHLY
jgi:hypothetical protein